jgi:putative redox protein
MHVELDQLGDDLEFNARNASGYDFSLTSDPDGDGVSPMEMVALGLGGCSSIDILSILEKQRQPVEQFSVDVDAERADDQVPAVFTRMHAHYEIEGEVEPEKVRRAVELSLEKYCSVSHMLESTVTISYAFTVNGTEYDGAIREAAE